MSRKFVNKSVLYYTDLIGKKANDKTNGLKATVNGKFNLNLNLIRKWKLLYADGVHIIENVSCIHNVSHSYARRAMQFDMIAIASRSFMF